MYSYIVCFYVNSQTGFFLSINGEHFCPTDNKKKKKWMEPR